MSVREIRSVRVIYRDGGQWEYGPAHFSLLPAPDRIALARALVADMPGVVCGMVPDADEAEQSSDHETAIWGQGYNAAIAAMLANREKNDGR